MAKADDLRAKFGLGGPPLGHIRSAPPAIPDHEMVRCIGQGSYGEVWLARSTVGTYRAVKVVYRDNFKDARPYEREFSGIQKYEPISRSNEGLVDVLQIGRNDAEGYFYYVMELADDAEGPEVRGQRSEVRSQKPEATLTRPADTLSHRMGEGRGEGSLSPDDYAPKTLSRELQHRGRLPFEECIQLGLTLNLALGHLHRNGLIHRDVKPSNIIFVNGVPKLADIGLVTDSADAQSFVGTEGFIPPEGPNSPQADIYALGKVLYEASMGKDRQEFPEPFTSLGLDAESKALMELNAVLLKACASKPKDRYQSAEEMNADLALLHSGKSVRRTHLLERRLAVMTRLGVGVGLIALLAVGAYVIAQNQARRAKEISQTESKLRLHAEVHRRKAETEAAKSDQVARFLQDMLKGVKPGVALGRDTTLLREILDKTALNIDKGLTNQPEVAVQLLLVIAETYGDLELFQPMETIAQKALRLSRSRLREKHPLISAVLMKLGDAQNHLGQMSQAEKSLRESVARRRAQGNDTDNPPLYLSLNSLAVVLWKRGKLSEAEGLMRETLVLSRKVVGNDDDDTTEIGNLAGVLREEGKTSEAEAALRDALARIRRMHGDQSTAVPRTLCNLAMVLETQRKFSEAEALILEALPLISKLKGAEHPDVALALHCLSGVLRKQGKLAQAEVRQREALERWRKHFNNEGPNVAEAVAGLGSVLRDEGKLTEAENLYREALAMRRKLFGNEDPRVANSLGLLAEILERQRKLAEAEPMRVEKLATERKVFGDENRNTLKSMTGLAIVYVERGCFIEAENLLRELLGIQRKLFSNESKEVFETLVFLGETLLRQSKSTEAEVLLREAVPNLEKYGNASNSFNSYVQGLLGWAWLGEKKFADAEPLLLQAYESLKQRNGKKPSPSDGQRLKELGKRIVRLYQGWDKPDKAAEWRQKLSAANTSPTPP